MKVKKISCGDIFEIKGVNNDKLMVTSVNKVDSYYRFTLICGYVIYIPVNSGNVEFPLNIQRITSASRYLGKFREIENAMKFNIMSSPFKNMRCSKVHYHYLIMEYFNFQKLFVS